MDLHYLKLFNVLAAELSFSKAANMLYISQPAVSMQIKKLENDLGCKLFNKVGKHLYLSESGKLLYEYTRRIFTLVEEAERNIYSSNGVIKGTINIGASNTPGTYILPRILGEFKEMYPEVDANLHIANTYEIERLIFENSVDFAVNGGEILYSSVLCVEKLVDDEVVFIASPGNRLLELENVEISDLVGCKYIVHERNSQIYKIVEDILYELDLPLNINMKLGSIDAIKQAVSAGLGISIIPRSAIKNELKFGLLKEFRVNGKEWRYPYKLIYHKNRQLSYAAAELIKLIRERISLINNK
ncbi:MAG: LysR substrate-binding domain-containing protein [Bacillota bacterium]